MHTAFGAVLRFTRQFRVLQRIGDGKLKDLVASAAMVVPDPASLFFYQTQMVRCSIEVALRKVAVARHNAFEWQVLRSTYVYFVPLAALQT